jgi:hypothetical protein
MRAGLGDESLGCDGLDGESLGDQGLRIGR